MVRFGVRFECCLSFSRETAVASHSADFFTLQRDDYSCLLAAARQVKLDGRLLSRSLSGEVAHLRRPPCTVRARIGCWSSGYSLALPHRQELEGVGVLRNKVVAEK